MDEATALEALASLAQPTRLAVVRRLLARYPASIAAGELAKACDAPHNTMSSHLSILTRAGLIEVEKSGTARRSKLNYLRDRKGKQAMAVREKAQ